MNVRPAIVRWVGFLRTVHGAAAPRPLFRPEEAQARRREATQDALLSIQLRADARPRP